MGLSAAVGPAPRGERALTSQRAQEVRNFWGARQSQEFRAIHTARDRWGVVIPDFDLSERVIGACIEVHRLLGPGLLENVYEECLCRELALRGMRFERQKQLPIEYKGATLERAYRVDLVVEAALLVEVKSVEALLDVHAAQVITYLRMGNLPSGVLVNFNAVTIRGNLRRLWRTPKPS
jgi:GxxExxY protein